MPKPSRCWHCDDDADLHLLDFCIWECGICDAHMHELALDWLHYWQDWEMHIVVNGECERIDRRGLLTEHSSDTYAPNASEVLSESKGKHQMSDEAKTNIFLLEDTAEVETNEDAVIKRLEKMGFEGEEGEDEGIQIFNIPRVAVEISSRGISRQTRAANMTEKEKKALRERLQAGKAAKNGGEAPKASGKAKAAAAPSKAAAGAKTGAPARRR